MHHINKDSSSNLLYNHPFLRKPPSNLIIEKTNMQYLVNFLLISVLIAVASAFSVHTPLNGVSVSKTTEVSQFTSETEHSGPFHEYRYK